MDYGRTKKWFGKDSGEIKGDIAMSKLGSKIKLLSGQHIEAENTNIKGLGTPYLTGPADFVGKKPIATKYTEISKVCCNKNDILITVKGAGTGKIAIADKKYCISRQLMAIRCEKIDPIFTQYLIEFNERKFNLSAAGLIPGISRIDVLNLKVPGIQLPEQKAIADLLSTWDEAIEKTERLIQVKEKKLGQMSKLLLFGYKRLYNKQSELVQGQFFKYPSDWDLVKVNKIAKEVSVRNNESEETVLSCSKYDGFVNSLDYFGKQVFSTDTSNYKVIKKGQFGYPSNHIEEGSIGLLEHCEKGIVSPIYIVFETSKEKVYPLYLYKLFKTDIYQHIFQVSTSSSVDRRGSLRWGDFSKIKVLLPSLEEQRQIAEVLTIIQREIDLLKQLVDKYKTQKWGLMQKMLTGVWRMKPKIIKKYEGDEI